MAEIKLEERSSGLKWLWILLALLLVLLLLWWLWPDDDAEVDDLGDEAVAVQEVQDADVAMADPADPAMGATTALPLAMMVDDPSGWIGRTVDGQARVVEVPTDRGFWLENDGARVFALIVDQPRDAVLDINPGMEVDVSSAIVRDADDYDEEDLRGDDLDADTEAILADQELFLVIEESNFQRWDG